MGVFGINADFYFRITRMKFLEYRRQPVITGVALGADADDSARASVQACDLGLGGP